MSRKGQLFVIISILVLALASAAAQGIPPRGTRRTKSLA